jgi:hypothetical protein
MDQDDMNETMSEINSADGAPVVVNIRNSLESDIADIKKNILDAQEDVNNSNLETTLMSAITPEQANETKKILVFLKKDLANKQEQFKELDEKL